MFELSEAIRLLQERGWTQGEIADHIGMHYSFVNRIANGKPVYVDWRVGICIMGLAFSHAVPPRSVRREIVELVLKEQSLGAYRMPRKRRPSLPPGQVGRSKANG